MFDKLALLAYAEAWVAAAREVVDGTLTQAADEVAISAGTYFLDERGKGLEPRQRVRLLGVYLGAFLDAVEAFQAA